MEREKHDNGPTTPCSARGSHTRLAESRRKYLRSTDERPNSGGRAAPKHLQTQLRAWAGELAPLTDPSTSGADILALMTAVREGSRARGHVAIDRAGQSAQNAYVELFNGASATSA